MRRIGQGSSACLVVTMMLLAGCVSASKPRSEELVIHSDPTGATVRLSNGCTGRTPASFEVVRKEPIGITVSLEGYVTMSAELKPRVSLMPSKATEQRAVTGALVGGGAAGQVASAGPLAAGAVVPVFWGVAGLWVVTGLAFDAHSGSLYVHHKGPVVFKLQRMAAPVGEPSRPP